MQPTILLSWDSEDGLLALLDGWIIYGKYFKWADVPAALASGESSFKGMKVISWNDLNSIEYQSNDKKRVNLHSKDTLIQFLAKSREQQQEIISSLKLVFEGLFKQEEVLATRWMCFAQQVPYMMLVLLFGLILGFFAWMGEITGEKKIQTPKTDDEFKAMVLQNLGSAGVTLVVAVILTLFVLRALTMKRFIEYRFILRDDSTTTTPTSTHPQPYKK